MLAQNFKTPADLGVSKVEFYALIKVLGMLERGELVDHKCINSHGKFEPTIPNGFNMNCSGEKTACGTVACIGGWIAILLEKPHTYVYETRANLHNLFWGYLPNTTVAEAAIATRNFLTFGTALWNEIRNPS